MCKTMSKAFNNLWRCYIGVILRMLLWRDVTVKDLLNCVSAWSHHAIPFLIYQKLLSQSVNNFKFTSNQRWWRGSYKFPRRTRLFLDNLSVVRAFSCLRAREGDSKQWDHINSVKVAKQVFVAKQVSAGHVNEWVCTLKGELNGNGKRDREGIRSHPCKEWQRLLQHARATWFPHPPALPVNQGSWCDGIFQSWHRCARLCTNGQEVGQVQQP